VFQLLKKKRWKGEKKKDRGVEIQRHTNHTLQASSEAGPKHAGEMGKLAGEGMMLKDDY